MKYVTGVLGIVALIAVITFSIQNLAEVEIAFLLWSVTVPKVVVIMGAYVLGMLSGWGLVEVIKWFAKQ